MGLILMVIHIALILFVSCGVEYLDFLHKILKASMNVNLFLKMLNYTHILQVIDTNHGLRSFGRMYKILEQLVIFGLLVKVWEMGMVFQLIKTRDICHMSIHNNMCGI